MLNRRGLKYIALILIASYLSVIGSECALAAGPSRFFAAPQLLAQAENPGFSATPSISTAEREARREIYLSKIQRLEANVNGKRGTRNTLLTVAVASGLIGAGVIFGSTEVREKVDDIRVKPENEEDIDAALSALDIAQGVGGGIVGLGGLGLLGYLVYTAIISSRQKEIDQLRAEMESEVGSLGGSSDYLPPYLRENEAANAIWTDISDAKKSAGTARSFQGFFTRLAFGSILSGGFVMGLSGLTNEVVDQIDIDERDEFGNLTDEGKAKENAIDAADNLQTIGLVLLGVGVTSGVTSYLLGRRAQGKEDTIEELEDQLLLLADRFRIQPRPDGVMLMYSFQF